MFNVKFRFSDAQINYSNPPIIKPDTLGHRYDLMDKKTEFGFILNDEGKIETLDTSDIIKTTKAKRLVISNGKIINK